MNKIIERRKEQEDLRKILESSDSAFVAIYGRLGIGKTYLIKNFFKDKGLFFHLTAIQDGILDIQLVWTKLRIYKYLEINLYSYSFDVSLTFYLS